MWWVIAVVAVVGLMIWEPWTVQYKCKCNLRRNNFYCPGYTYSRKLKKRQSVFCRGCKGTKP